MVVDFSEVDDYVVVVHFVHVSVVDCVVRYAVCRHDLVREVYDHVVYAYVR